MWQGCVTHLHTAPAGSTPMQRMDVLTLIKGAGIEGDRYATHKGFYSDRPEPGRQITLFEIETLEALKRDHGVELSPDEHRRNVTVSGVPLNHLVGRRFRVGEAVLEATRLSTPCKHIEDVTGKVISKWLINRSGLNCIILEGGRVRVGDKVHPC
ncbi:MAG: MOSC domain-containing protein [Rhodobacteraceae bacterium]|nr:MOSC domain-containing protein [Paracoccaceae bacterium]